MKYLLLCATLLIFMAGSCHGKPIFVGVMPLLKSELTARQLSPIKAGLNAQGLAIELVYPKTYQEFAEYCKLSKINLAYVGAGYAGLLKNNCGFVPLLTSDQTVNIVLFSKKDISNYSQLKKIKGKVFYPKDNLQARFEMKKMFGGAENNLIMKSTADHVIYSVLEQKNSAGIVLRTQLGLMNKSFKSDIYIHKSEPVGRLYLMMAPQLKAQKKLIQEKFLKFHKDWDDSDKQYHYLNFFSFKKWHSSHQTGLERSSQFQTFLKKLTY